MLDGTDPINRKRHMAEDPALLFHQDALHQLTSSEDSIPTARGTPTRMLTLRDTTNISKASPFQLNFEPDKMNTYAAECNRIGSLTAQPPISKEKDVYFELSQSLQSLKLPALHTSPYSGELPTARSTMKVIHQDSHVKSDVNEAPTDEFTAWRMSETLGLKRDAMWDEGREHSGSSQSHVALLPMLAPTIPKYPSDSTARDEPPSYTEIFRDQVGGKLSNVPHDYTSLIGIPHFQTSAPNLNLYQVSDLRCDKCMENIPHGNFREHNIICKGKKCNRCFQTVIGSYESHKVSCLVRRCDRCGLIPRETFREHNRICKLISSSLWKRWHSRENNEDFPKRQ